MMTETTYNELCENAKYFEENSEPLKAIGIYQNILESYPEDGSILFDLGDLYCQQESYNEAVECYLEIIEKNLHEDKDLAHAMLGICYMSLAEQREDTINEQRAITHYESAIQLNPAHSEDSKLLFDLGLAYTYTKDYDNAIATFEKLIEVAPGEYLSYSYLSSIYSELDMPEVAIRYRLKAIEINPKDYNAYYMLGQMYSRQHKYDEAIDAYETALKLNDQFSEAYCNIADTLNKVGEYNLAIMNAKKATELDPNDKYAFCTLGESYEKLNDLDEAKKYFGKSLQLDTEFKDAKLGLARVG